MTNRTYAILDQEHIPVPSLISTNATVSFFSFLVSGILGLRCLDLFFNSITKLYLGGLI